MVVNTNNSKYQIKSLILGEEMKDRIVITDDKFVRQAHNSIIVGCPLEFEQVPETFEELKELCFKLPNKIEYYTYNEEKLIGISGMYFWQKGRITHNIYDDGVYVYAKNRTPAQMWQIIKSLIGEE